jgi:hypothetical protein
MPDKWLPRGSVDFEKLQRDWDQTVGPLPDFLKRTRATIGATEMEHDREDRKESHRDMARGSGARSR